MNEETIVEGFSLILKLDEDKSVSAINLEAKNDYKFNFHLVAQIVKMILDHYLKCTPEEDRKVFLAQVFKSLSEMIKADYEG
jgi:hypothetical protein